MYWLLYSGHLGFRHVEAVLRVVEEANQRIEGMKVYAAIQSERLATMKLKPGANMPVEKGRNFEMVAQLLGRGTELPQTTHADGADTSWTLYFYLDAGPSRLPTISTIAVFSLYGGLTLWRPHEESEW